MTALETSGLGKRYKQSWALRDCSLTLPAGRIAGLVGPNGAGKTTLLHLAVGLLRSNAGSIRVLGANPYDNRDLLARIGFLAQDTPLYQDFTGTELLTLGRKLNRRWDDVFARERLAKLGVPLDRKVATLSGGQRAQLALALAIAKRPELLLLDEPVASLDPLARREFLQTLIAIVAEFGLTVVLSSHLVADLERVCDHLIVLSEGQVQVFGETDDLLAAHRLLVGPRSPHTGIAGVAQVVRASDTERQTTVLARVNGPIPDPMWTVNEVTLEELVLAYLGAPSVSTLPGPARAEMRS
jgi:ABC-2 type transport system ATP-binding protein